MSRIATGLSTCLVLAISIPAYADGTGTELGTAPTPAPAASASVTAAPPPPMGVVEERDGFRMRHGVAASFGEELGSGPSSGLSGFLGGVDWRIGAQINNLYAVYVDTHLSFGTAKIGAQSGVTGNFASALMAERTLADKFFVGAGGGYGVLNNPSGPLAQVRAGWYPAMSSSETAARRRGLVLGADVRAYFAGPGIGTVTQLSVSLGYEKY
jgi:hypothetical protein